MQVKDLIVTGDAKILGNLYTKEGNVAGGSGGGSSGDSGVTYKLSKSGSTITLTGSDGSTSSVTDANTDTNTTYSAATTSAAGLMSAADKTKLDGIATGANNYTYTHPSYTARTGVPTANATLSHGGTFTVTQPVCDATGHITAMNTRTYTLPADSNTTYSAGTGISLSGTTFSNSGVRSIATGSSNGTISVNTNGTTANVAVKGLGSAAYTASTAYATSGHSHSNYMTTSNPTGTGYFSLNRQANTTIGTFSFAAGNECIASGANSHAEGTLTVASGGASHAEGCGTQATELRSHAEGYKTEASGESSHAEGCETVAMYFYDHAEGYQTSAEGWMSHAEGNGTTASEAGSHAEGAETIASGVASHAEGARTTASNYASHAQGKYNKAMTDGGSSGNTTGDAFVIGNGTSVSALSNAFRVTYAGAAYGLSSFNSSGADYAEFFEWVDGNIDNEDRVGYFVTLDGEKIRKAQKGDYLLGIVSGNPCIIGNADEDWLNRWEKDDFGRFVKEEVVSNKTKLKMTKVPVLNINGNPTDETTFEMQEIETGEVTVGWRYKQNPDYDDTQTYVERKDRKEWDYVGMLGVLSVWDDGTCEVNGYCNVADGGIATKADSGYRVIKRVNENIVKVIFR